MTLEELTPEAVSLLRSLIDRPRPIENSALLQLMIADRLVIGSPNKVHITQSGVRLLVEFEAAKEWY